MVYRGPRIGREERPKYEKGVIQVVMGKNLTQDEFREIARGLGLLTDDMHIGFVFNVAFVREIPYGEEDKLVKKFKELNHPDIVDAMRCSLKYPAGPRQ